MGIDFKEALNKWVNQQPEKYSLPKSTLPDGWTAWIHNGEPDLSLDNDDIKIRRPWSRGRTWVNSVQWFPKTTQKKKKKWSVFCPAGLLPGLEKDGYYLIHWKFKRTVCFHPKEGCYDKIGILPESFIDQLESRSAEYYENQRKKL